MVSRGRPKKKVVTRVESCSISTPGYEPVVLNIHVHIHSPIGSESQSVASNAQPVLHLHLDSITKDLVSSAISQKLSSSPAKSISAVRGRKSKKSPTASLNALKCDRSKNASYQSEMSDSSFDGFNPTYTSSQRQINGTDNLIEKIGNSESEFDSGKNNGNETATEHHVHKQCSSNTYPIKTDEFNIEKDNKCNEFHMSLRPRRQDVKNRKPNESPRGKRKRLRLRNSRIPLNSIKNNEESSGSLDDIEVGKSSCLDEKEINQREEHESVNIALKHELIKSITENVSCGKNVENSVPKSTVNDSSCKNDSNNCVHNVPVDKEDDSKSEYSDNELEISKSSVSSKSETEENHSEGENITDSFTLLLNASGGKGEMYARVYTPDKIASPEKIVIDEQASSIIDDLNFKELREVIFAEKSDNQILLKCKSFPLNEEPEIPKAVVNSVLNGSDIMHTENDYKSDDDSKSEKGLIIQAEVDKSGNLSDKNSDVLVQMKDEPETKDEELESSLKSETQTSTPIAKETNSTSQHEPETKEEELESSLKSKTLTSTPIAKETDSVSEFGGERNLKAQISNKRFTKARKIKKSLELPSSSSEEEEEWVRKVERCKKRFFSLERINTSLEKRQRSDMTEVQDSGSEDEIFRVGVLLNGKHGRALNSNCNHFTKESVIEKSKTNPQNSDTRSRRTWSSESEQSLVDNKSMKEDQRNEIKNSLYDEDEGSSAGGEDSVLRIDENEESEHDGEELKETRKSETFNKDNDDSCQNNRIGMEKEQKILNLDVSSIKWEREVKNKDRKEVDKRQKFEAKNNIGSIFEKLIEVNTIVTNQSKTVQEEVEVDEKSFDEMKREERSLKENEENKINESHHEREELECSLNNEGSSRESKMEVSSLSDKDEMEETCKRKKMENIKRTDEQKQEGRNENFRMTSEEKQMRSCEFRKRAKRSETKLLILPEKRKIDEINKKKRGENARLAQSKNDYENLEQKEEEITSDEKEYDTEDGRQNDGTISVKYEERKEEILSNIDETKEIADTDGKNSETSSEEEEEDDETTKRMNETKRIDDRARKSGETSSEEEEEDDETTKRMNETKRINDRARKSGETSSEEEEDDKTTKRMNETKRIDDKARKSGETSSEEEEDDDETTKRMNKTKRINDRARKSGETSSEEEEEDDETTKRMNETKRIDDRARKSSETSSEEEEEEEDDDETTKRMNETKRINDRARKSGETSSEEEEEDDKTTKRMNETKRIDDRARISSETSSEEEEEDDDETTKRMNETKRINDRARKSGETSSEEEEEDDKTTKRMNETKRIDDKARKSGETSSEEEEDDDDETTKRMNKTKRINDRARKSGETSSEEEEEDNEATKRMNETKRIDDRARKSSETSSEEEEDDETTKQTIDKTKGIDDRARRSSETSSEEEEDDETIKQTIDKMKGIDDRAGGNSETSSEETKKSQSVEYEDNCKIIQRKLNIELIQSSERGKTKEIDEKKRKGSFISVDNIVGNRYLTKEVEKTRMNCISPDNIYERWSESESDVSSGISEVRKVIKALESCPKFAEFRREKNKSANKYGMGEMLSNSYKQSNIPQPEIRNSFYFKNQKFNSSKSKQKDITEIQLKKLNRCVHKNDFVMGLKNKKVKKSKKNEELKRKMSQGSMSPPPAKMPKKGNEQKVEEKRDVKKGLENKDYIPLDVSGPTKFSVAKLNKLNSHVEHDAASFKQRMLFGDRVKRFASSKGLIVCRMKQKAGESCSK